VSFPVTDKYFLRFRHSDIGLTPTFTQFKRTDTLANVTPPAITEVGNGTYYFSITFTAGTDPGYVFEVDGGSSIPTEEVRYIADTISPKDYFMDEPVSQVKDDIWNDTTDRGAGTKGNLVEAIGASSDASGVATVFGELYATRDALRGTDATMDLTDLSVAIAAIATSLGTDVTTITTAITNAVTAIKGSSNKDVSQVDTSLTTVSDSVAAMSLAVFRALGMLHENAVLDRCTYNQTTNNLLSARLRLYDSSANAQAAKAAGDGSDYLTGMIGQYSIVAEYTGDNMTNYLVAREFPV
jgi:hypothetical protein